MHRLKDLQTVHAQAFIGKNDGLASNVDFFYFMPYHKPIDSLLQTGSIMMTLASTVFSHFGRLPVRRLAFFLALVCLPAWASEGQASLPPVGHPAQDRIFPPGWRDPQQAYIEKRKQEAFDQFWYVYQTQQRLSQKYPDIGEQPSADAMKHALFGLMLRGNMALVQGGRWGVGNPVFLGVDALMESNPPVYMGYGLLESNRGRVVRGIFYTKNGSKWDMSTMTDLDLLWLPASGKGPVCAHLIEKNGRPAVQIQQGLAAYVVQAPILYRKPILLDRFWLTPDQAKGCRFIPGE